jgi:restriction system protein
VVVQCKRYADNPVGSSEVRDFWSSIRLYNAVYGYFVTTSTFSRDAQQVLASAGWQIRRIDGYQLDALLRGRRREISLAWSEVLAQKNRGVLS